jgi:methionyl aminopeptidase
MRLKGPIKIKTREELDVLRRAGKILAKIVQELTCSLKIGLTTQQVDEITGRLISDNDVQPAFKGYRGFPASACISINQEVVHGVPGSRKLQNGDIVSIDVGIIYQDYYSDTAFTVGMGDVSPERQRLMDITQKALYRGIAPAKVNNHLSDISHAIQTFVEAHRLSVVRDFVGHGIGRELHEEPEIPNFGPPHTGPILREGMVLAIEPMVNLGTWQTKVKPDGWTIETSDGQPSAHFEHTCALTENGPEILTQWDTPKHLDREEITA